MKGPALSTGIKPLDDILEELRLGDNVVWQINDLCDYTYFAEAFTGYVIENGNNCIYLRFAPHTPILTPRQGLTIEEVDPSNGFAAFSEQIHSIISSYSHEKFFVFDNLSCLVEEWATDELVANFFQITCPYLGELDTVAYFALTRGRHANKTVARIRDTTQVLLDLYRINGQIYIHPLKVLDRYSAQMYMPHEAAGDRWQPVFDSGKAAALSQSAFKEPLRAESTPIAPWDIVYNKLVKYRSTPEKWNLPEVEALKQEFSRMLIGRHPQFNHLANRYFTLEDLLAIKDRMIGTGRIGGKTTGMLLARKILEEEQNENDFSEILDAHDSFYIGSDVFFTFLINNNLFRQLLEQPVSPTLSAEEYNALTLDFLNGSFPAEIMDQFKNMLNYFGQAPIIVRSSSLLEDSFGDAFAGKYRSEFCANQGSPNARLENFLRAIKLVYASTMSPDALSYRQKRGLADKDEQMAILVQRVSGRPYRSYFFPPLAGVAFSRNPYAWSKAIDPNKGVIRLVFGLGTRAVDRVSNDYPRMIAINKPELRPDTGTKAFRYSQRNLDLISIDENRFATRLIEEAISDDYPGIHNYLSIYGDGYFYDPPYREDILESEYDYALTFNKLISRSNFITLMDKLLSTLDQVYGQPVDTEFTAIPEQNDGIRINLLQCRPLKLPGMLEINDFPDKIESSRILFKTDKVINGGLLDQIRYAVLVTPEGYNQIKEPTRKKETGRIIGSLNRHPDLIKGGFILIGPGRWGSTNLDLGINATYSDINNTKALVEVASSRAGFAHELSYGTHFFQDLVEDHIIYLPVYPDQEEACFNTDFFDKAKNILKELLPDYKDFSEIVKVIDTAAEIRDLQINIAADPGTRKAVCYLG